MLNIQRFVCNPIRENTYVVSDETKECVIVDCGAYYEPEKEAIKEYIDTNGLTPKHLLVTHGHVDHNFGDKFVFDNWGLRPEIGSSDEPLLKTLPEQAKSICGIDDLTDDDFTYAGKCLDGSDIISFGSHTFTVLETPGHSWGGLTFYCEAEKVAFTGDTLFQGSIGRTDLDGGSMFMIIQSLRMLCQLPDDVRVLPGHGPATTIGAEIAGNPYLDR